MSGKAPGREVDWLERAVLVWLRYVGSVAKHVPFRGNAVDLSYSLSFALTQLEATFASGHDLNEIGSYTFEIDPEKASTPLAGVQSVVIETTLKCYGTKPRPPPEGAVVIRCFATYKTCSRLRHQPLTGKAVARHTVS